MACSSCRDFPAGYPLTILDLFYSKVTLKSLHWLPVVRRLGHGGPRRVGTSAPTAGRKDGVRGQFIGNPERHSPARHDVLGWSLLAHFCALQNDRILIFDLPSPGGDQGLSAEGPERKAAPRSLRTATTTSQQILTVSESGQVKYPSLLYVSRDFRGMESSRRRADRLRPRTPAIQEETPGPYPGDSRRPRSLQR
jgi:hypothetical protein